MPISVSMSIKIFSVAKIAELLWSPQRRSRVTIQNQEMIVEKRNIFRRWRKTGRDGDDWMSAGSEFQSYLPPGRGSVCRPYLSVNGRYSIYPPMKDERLSRPAPTQVYDLRRVAREVLSIQWRNKVAVHGRACKYSKRAPYSPKN